MNWVAAYVYAYLSGMAIILLKADFDDPTWVAAWGIWTIIAGGSFLSFFCLYNVTRYKGLKWVTFYTGGLLAWELSALITGLSINNEYAVAVAFGLLAILCIALTWRYR